jgi:hypothetical protein
MFDRSMNLSRSVARAKQTLVPLMRRYKEGRLLLNWVNAVATDAEGHRVVTHMMMVK